MKKILTAMVAGGLGLMASAATVERTFARQQWPWQHHFEINYVLKTDADEACDVSLKVSAAGEEFAIPATELLGETKGLVSGVYKLLWNPASSAAPTAAWLMAHSGDLAFSVVTTPAEQPSEYLIVDLSGGAEAVSWPATRRCGRPRFGWTDEYKTTKLVLRRIPCGGRGDTFSSATGVSYMKGNTSDDPMLSRDMGAKSVTLTNDFYIGVFELTQKQYQLITGTTVTSGSANGDKYPQSNIGYYAHIRGEENGSQWPNSSAVDAGSLMGILRAKVRLPAEIPADWKFDLPTESQWEYACRAGTTGPWNNGLGYDSYTYTYEKTKEFPADHNLDLVGWNQANAGGKHHTVGELPANAWGLYDMHGNTYEFCLDYMYNGSSTTGMAGTEPKGSPIDAPTTSTARVIKGGSYSVYGTTVTAMKSAAGCRSCARVLTYVESATQYRGCRIALRNSTMN